MMTLTREEAAAYLRSNFGLRCSTQTLENLATLGTGPEFFRINGRWVRYSKAALDAWGPTRISRPMRKASDIPIGARKDASSLEETGSAA